jgi:hypothetical protein
MGLRFMSKPANVVGLGTYLALVGVCARSRHVGPLTAMIIPTLGYYVASRAWRAAEDVHRLAQLAEREAAGA